ncbi:uncharacterized protein LOC103714174 [Phoenix dactylifera]|uniref:Uncharacterized protein LOC103714174 n=1 Tax=Phoenix dactylifera TaxID=42345 RepID=A0A8B7CHX6_PHODC|nr:uncharacterized protein LOC103714174 [Phoenix dactylifera]
MAVSIRAKRVTDPLDDEAKARLRGDDEAKARWMTGYAGSSSGSEHEATPCLSGLVHAFLLESAAGAPSAAAPGGYASDVGGASDDDDAGDRAAAAKETVRDLLDPPVERDPFRARLVSDVLAAAEAFAGVRKNGSAFRRAVMATLRVAGYNAGICKARWESSGGVTAGTYEYIDVVAAAAAGEVRYIVDMEFAADFEVARATKDYRRVLAALPRVAVARTEAVRQVVRVVADAARRSLRSQGLHVPPWRKSRYMLAKWLGPYRRTVNTLPSSAGARMAGGGGAEVKCRTVGFPEASAGRLVPRAGRTR